jgi:hypothetical protein
VSAEVKSNSKWKYCGGVPIPTCPTYFRHRGGGCIKITEE